MPESTFRMSMAFRHGRTKVDDLYFEAPFKLMTPFHDGTHTDCMVMLASPGFLKGDAAHIDCTFGAGTDTTIRTQSYEKVLDTADGEASRTINLNLQDDAKAVFLPFPVIPFAHSTFSNVTIAHISPQSTFAYADVVTCGRVGMGERWKMHMFRNTTRIFVDEPDGEPIHRGRPRKDRGEPFPHLVFADHLLLDPNRFNYTEIAMWGEYTHCGMMYIHIPQMNSSESSRHNHTKTENTLVDNIRKLSKNKELDSEVGVSCQTNGIVVRILSKRGDDAFTVIDEIAQSIP